MTVRDRYGESLLPIHTVTGSAEPHLNHVFLQLRRDRIDLRQILGTQLRNITRRRSDDVRRRLRLHPRRIDKVTGLTDTELLQRACLPLNAGIHLPQAVQQRLHPLMLSELLRHLHVAAVTHIDLRHLPLL